MNKSDFLEPPIKISYFHVILRLSIGVQLPLSPTRKLTQDRVPYLYKRLFTKHFKQLVHRGEIN